MMILNRTAKGCDLIPEDSLFFENRVLFLDGEINRQSVSNIIKQLGLLSLNGNKDVLLVINSEGGEINAGLTLINTIKTLPFKVNVYCNFYCYSMGAIIFISATGKRILSSTAKLMLHEPLVSNLSTKSVTEIEEISKDLNKYKDVLKEIIKTNSEMSDKQIKASLMKDTFYVPEEALSLGLCDEIKDMIYLGECV